MTIIPVVHPPVAHEERWKRDLAPSVAFRWLAQGWRDFWINPASSFAYGVLIFLLSLGIVGGLFFYGYDYILFPALAGFMVVGPILAIGLYEKSRRIAAGEPVSLRRMIFVRPQSGAQVLFTGALLCLLMLLWMRAAVIIYALFFGMRPFPGIDHIAQVLVSTPTGWGMLFVGCAVGALFGGFAFAISAFSVPMQLDRRVDALTAMGTSLALVWNNMPLMLTWGAIMLVLVTLSVATGFLGLIIVFPVLGYGTWHAYADIKP